MTDPKNLNRRDFMKLTGSIGAGSLLAGTGAMAQTSPAGVPSTQETSSVPTRSFGKTGVQVSILSLGGMFDIPSNQLLLKQALKWGVTHWDTADCYEGGKSELGIGQFFSKYPETRKQVFLVTKSDDRDAAGMTKLLNRSLERLKTDYVDLYFIHGMSKMSEIGAETKAWAEKAKSEGKIKFFGFSTHSNMEDLMIGASKLGWIDAIMMTYNFRLMHQDKMKQAVDACTKAGIALTAMKTQGGGSVKMESEAELEMAGKFLKAGFNDKQAKLKAVWQNERIANICSQMPNITILMDNIAAALNRTKLSAHDYRLLDRYASETCSSYCAGCAHLCESAVGGDVPVRDVMRCLMYFHTYEERDRARALFAELPESVRDRLDSIDFGAAERTCPQKIRIGQMMREAATILG